LINQCVFQYFFCFLSTEKETFGVLRRGLQRLDRRGRNWLLSERHHFVLQDLGGAIVYTGGLKIPQVYV
jgi:hypothetical protein